MYVRYIYIHVRIHRQSNRAQVANTAYVCVYMCVCVYTHRQRNRARGVDTVCVFVCMYICVCVCVHPLDNVSLLPAYIRVLFLYMCPCVHLTTSAYYLHIYVSSYYRCVRVST
jgi:hypothetical protein